MTAPSHMQNSAAEPTASQSGSAVTESAEPEPPQPGNRIDLDIVCEDGDGWVAFGDFEAGLTAAAHALAVHPGLVIGVAEAVVALASDAEVAALNGTYRDQAKPTNVLSFQASVPPHRPNGRPGGRRFLGDIILARETVWAEAADQGIQPIHHLQHLVVHGLLHLLGYDHDTDQHAIVMEGLETAILATLAIPDPYRDVALTAGDPVGTKP